MEVKIRRVCRKCKGTAKNGLTDAEALKRIDEMPLGGVLELGQLAPKSHHQKMAEIQTCGYCHDGYNEEWISLNELLSAGA